MDSIQHTHQDHHMHEHAHKRPFLITMLCSFFFIFWIVNVVSLTSTVLLRMGSNQPAAWSDVMSQLSLIFTGAQVNLSWVTLLITAGLVAGIIGYWLFQKWAVIVYSAASLALLIISIPPRSSAPSTGLYIALIVYILVTIFALNATMITLGVRNFKKMK